MSWGTEDHKHDAYDVYGVAEEHHQHYNLENQLEAQTPRARQLQTEADLAAADLAESSYGQDPPVGADRHGPGCQCPYCPGEEPEEEPPVEDYDPGPEVDDEGGMSEYRHVGAPEEPW